jgi:hypothetical protein
MKMSKSFQLHNQLRSGLGDDLVYSLAMDGDAYMLLVSAHKSVKQKFKGAVRMRTIIITEEDMQRPVGDIVIAVVHLLRDELETVIINESPHQEECIGCGDSNVTQ